ncbi:MAG: glycosyltransferase family 2 protein [Nitrososphaerota archaeon]
MVSVIIPTLNEEGTIGICIQKIRHVFEKYGIKGEIIVSDNSDDNTPNIARSMGAIVIHPDKKGYGYAYRYAFRYAKGKFIVMGDGDNTYDFSEMQKLLEPLMKNEADIVIGSRFKGRIEKGAMPLHHKYVGNPLLTFLINLFFKAGISDANSGFRAIRRDALEKLELKCDGMDFASEMIIEACKNGLRIKEVPINYYRRKNSTSKLKSFQDGWRHVKFMLLNTPRHTFIYPGISIFFIGLVLLISAYFKVFMGYLPGVHSMIAGSLMLLAGYNVTFFGIFVSIKKRQSLPKFFTLEKGATIAAILFTSGLIYALILIAQWIDSGFKHLPVLEHSILAFTLISIGIETFFSAFMLSILAENI